MSRMRHTFCVLNLSWSCVKGDLRTHFSKYGGVMGVQIPMNTRTGFNKGMGFVDVLGEDGFQEKVLQDYHTINQREVRVMRKIYGDRKNSRKTETSTKESS